MKAVTPFQLDRTILRDIGDILIGSLDRTPNE
jgi:hypothetical protein